jgi:hypothetical protein
MGRPHCQLNRPEGTSEQQTVKAVAAAGETD